jgi:iron complex transport system permease protein
MINKYSISTFVLVIVLSILLISFGETGFTFSPDILLEIRLPKVITCIFAGGLLAIAGLLMQVFFQNPLAGPDILGISSGSVLFVAIFGMASTALPESIFNFGSRLMSLMGALSVFLFLMMFMKKNKSKSTILIVGILVSSFINSIISLLVNNANAVNVKNYLIWSQGTFRNVYIGEVGFFVIISTFALIPVFILAKQFNLYLLGESYARSLGLNVKRTRLYFVCLASAYVSIVSFYCGPIGFIGVVAAFVAKRIIKRASMNYIIPVTFLIGSIIALFSEIIMTYFYSFNLTTNSVLGFIGIPIIIYHALRNRELIS